MSGNFSSSFDHNRRTWHVKAELPIQFTVQYSTNIFSPENHDLISFGEGDRRILVVDSVIYNLHSTAINNYFKQLKIDPCMLVIDCNEELKTWETAETIMTFFEKSGLLRRESVIAIGGGVLLDIVGFCASIYRRGIPYIKVPTTLLAIVDASVGAKVAVNHYERRNRIGAYYPAAMTLIDKKFIETQTEREIVNGIAEIFKMAVIKDPILFNLLSKNYKQLVNEKFQYGAVPVQVINRAITGMIEELAPNLWEKNLDRCVDFGHSFSPIIEMKNLPELLHGEAVAIDCLFSSCLSHNRGYMSLEELRNVYATAKNLHLPIYHKDFTDLKILNYALADTMKHRNNNQYLPLPLGIGNYKIINDMNRSELEKGVQLFDEMRKYND